MIGLKIKGIKLAIYFLAGLLILFLALFYKADVEKQKEKDSIDDNTIGAICSRTGEIDEESWNDSFTNAGVLENKADKFEEVAEKQGIDPVLFAAISLHETGWGKSDAIKNHKNPGGLMGSSGYLMVFDTLDEGIEAMGVTLHNRIIKDGLGTIEDLGNVYAPVGAENDPTNLNANWVPITKSIVKKLGGLTMNCEELGTGEFASPTGSMKITSYFGIRGDPFGGESQEAHSGLDFACSPGDKIGAVDNGTVYLTIQQGFGGGFGHHVIIDHGDKFTLYGHMETVSIDIGEKVEQGDVLGTCGSTGRSSGPHLHLGVHVGKDGYSDRVDPLPFFE